MKNPNNIKEIRFKKGVYQQKQMAKDLGVTRASVSRWENGLSYPSYPYLVKMSKYLGVTIQELFPGINDRVASETRREYKEGGGEDNK